MKNKVKMYLWNIASKRYLNGKNNKIIDTLLYYVVNLLNEDVGLVYHFIMRVAIQLEDKGKIKHKTLIKINDFCYYKVLKQCKHKNKAFCWYDIHDFD